MKFSHQDICDLKDTLLDLGVFPSNLKAVFLEGSSLYVREPKDLDFLVLTKQRPLFHKQPEGYAETIKGLPIDVNIFSVEQFRDINRFYKHQFYHEEMDYKLILGDADGIPWHTFTLGRLAEELEGFRAVLFDPYGDDYNPKRLLSLFVLARRLGFEVSDEKLEQAHRKELDPQDYKDLFEKVFEVATQQCLNKWTK